MGAREKGNRGAGEQRRKGAGRKGRTYSFSPLLPLSSAPMHLFSTAPFLLFLILLFHACTRDKTLSFDELEKKFGSGSSLSEAQKDEEWKEYEGKFVTWQGEIVYAGQDLFGALKLGVKQSKQPDKGYGVYDVLVNLKPDQQQKLLKLKKGNMVLYKGKLSQRRGKPLPFLPYTLEEGIIID